MSQAFIRMTLLRSTQPMEGFDMHLKTAATLQDSSTDLPKYGTIGCKSESKK